MQLSYSESEAVFITAMRDGMTKLSSLEVSLTRNEEDYREAKVRIGNSRFISGTLRASEPSYEEILLEVLSGGKTITAVCKSCNIPVATIVLYDVWRRVPTIDQNVLGRIKANTHNREDALLALQIIFYNKIIFHENPIGI